jgi:hypothetical protein
MINLAVSVTENEGHVCHALAIRRSDALLGVMMSVNQLYEPRDIKSMH